MWYYKAPSGARGPYSTEEICQLTARGALQRGTLVARDGDGSWIPLSSIPEFAALRAGSFHNVNPQVVATFGSSHVKQLYREHLNEIIRAQRILIGGYVALVAASIVLVLPLLLLEEPIRSLAAIAFKAVACVVLATCMARLAGALQITQWPWVLAACLPCWSLIALLVLMSRANGVLRSAGVSVGLLGGRTSPLIKA